MDSTNTFFSPDFKSRAPLAASFLGAENFKYFMIYFVLRSFDNIDLFRSKWKIKITQFKLLQLGQVRTLKENFFQRWNRYEVDRVQNVKWAGRIYFPERQNLDQVDRLRAKWSQRSGQMFNFRFIGIQAASASHWPLDSLAKYVTHFHSFHSFQWFTSHWSVQWFSVIFLPTTKVATFNAKYPAHLHANLMLLYTGR